MTAFLTYPHDANEQDSGAIIALSEALEREVGILTGTPFVIYRDKKDIKWGNQWREFVEQRPQESTLLLPVMTESYFKSSSCHNEYVSFRRFERSLGRQDLILPLLYADVIPAEKEAVAKIRKWKTEMMARQYVDWRSLRHEPTHSGPFRRAVSELGLSIRELLLVENNSVATKKQDTGKGQSRRKRDTQIEGQKDTKLSSSSAAARSDGGTYRFVSSGSNSELHVLDTKEVFIIDYSPILASNLDQFRIVRSEFESLVARELLSHRLMLKFDYESRAIPLLGGLTVFVTKTGERFVLEWLAQRQPSAELDEAWHRLCRAYYLATRLPYRGNPDLLSRKRTRKEAIDRISELVAEAQRFFVETTRIASNEALTGFDTRNSGAERALVDAEIAADLLEHQEGPTDSQLGKLVVPLEMAIPNIHKMMIEYGKFRKA